MYIKWNETAQKRKTRDDTSISTKRGLLAEHNRAFESGGRERIFCVYGKVRKYIKKIIRNVRESSGIKGPFWCLGGPFVDDGYSESLWWLTSAQAVDYDFLNGFIMRDFIWRFSEKSFMESVKKNMKVNSMRVSIASSAYVVDVRDIWILFRKLIFQILHCTRTRLDWMIISRIKVCTRTNLSWRLRGKCDKTRTRQPRHGGKILNTNIRKLGKSDGKP